MDIARTSDSRRKSIRHIGYLAGGLMLVAATSVGLTRLKPAAPVVDRAAIWSDTVKRGPMVRQVRGLGTLVPEDIRWVPATTEGRVERILLRPGTRVTSDSVILELSNPQLEQEWVDAQLKVKAAEASLQNLRVQLQNEFLQQKAAAGAVAAEYAKAGMRAEVKEALAARGLVSDLELKEARIDAEQLAVRGQIAEQQLASWEEFIRARMAVQQSDVDQARAFMLLKQRQRDELKVQAGLDGVLQVVPVEVGQHVMPGTNLARVANPTRLKAEIKIAETQARDVQVGQKCDVDTRNGVALGRVARIDPSVQNGTRTVDVELTSELPNGAVPDLTIDGTIELERLNDVLFVGRPGSGTEQRVVGLFKISADGATAQLVQVKLGRSSVNTVEVVSGLKAGDPVILSDMSAYDGFERIRLR